MRATDILVTSLDLSAERKFPSAQDDLGQLVSLGTSALGSEKEELGGGTSQKKQ